jgi:hypothetical protein
MEGDSTSHLNSAYLSCSLALSPLPPQLRLSLNCALSRIQQSSRESPSPAGDSCPFCFSSLDLTRANMETVSLKKSRDRLLKISCHLCKKTCKTRVVEPSKEAIPLNTVSSSIDCRISDSVSKKKKKKKDLNAGLNISSSSAKHSKPVLPKNSTSVQTKPVKTSGLTKSSMSKEKLKLLMGDNTPKRSVLQDFLKKL